MYGCKRRCTAPRSAIVQVSSRASARYGGALTLPGAWDVTRLLFSSLLSSIFSCRVVSHNVISSRLVISFCIMSWRVMSCLVIYRLLSSRIMSRGVMSSLSCCDASSQHELRHNMNLFLRGGGLSKPGGGGCAHGVRLRLALC